MMEKLRISMYKGLLNFSGTFIPSNACLVTFARKCGKSNCRCNRGHLHPANALKYRIDGVQKMKYVRQADVTMVRRQLYEIKGIEIIDRGGDAYSFTLAEMYPELTGTDIMIKAYEVFGQQKLHPTSLIAN